ncbi:polysaccharide deacetylase family protein [Bacillus sp. JJ1562]|uniref:polysaccharide deacetylase family protein n=1 Tax=Bacillus sp. JJ1562 TaxID=3122960 RepID=UPI003001DD14
MKYIPLILAIILMVAWDNGHVPLTQGGELVSTWDKGTGSSSHSVLVVYSTKTGEISDQQRVLDLLVGHFTSNIKFRSTKEVTTEDLKDVTHLFYHGQIKETLPKNFKTALTKFDGTLVAIGHNFEQLSDRFSFMKVENEVSVSKITNDTESIIIFPQSILHVTAENAETIVKASHGTENEYPLFLSKNQSYYYASPVIEKSKAIFLGEALHAVFGDEHAHIHPGYIRLEDIHPKVNAKKVMEIAEILKEKQIPYMVAVIPVYTNPETQKEYHFSDSPQLLKALKYMQNNGGSIVLHGYTHQFRADETGEGFEFWDVDNNMPIYHTLDEEVVKKTRSDFASNAEYEAFRKSQLDFETKYIEGKIQRGIDELVNYGLFPLAFEAPHYTMSQNGYKVVSNHFSTYVGQVQLSDENWEVMGTAPSQTQPTMFGGMTLLPETIGFVDEHDPNAIESMIKEAQRYTVMRDGFVAGFYHPYLGVEGFEMLLGELEKIPNVKWIDLKERVNTVKSENVTIVSGDGLVKVDINYTGLFASSLDYLFYRIKDMAQYMTWVMVGAGAFAVVLFTLYGLILRWKWRREYYG